MKMDMRFGTWNVQSLYRAGSLRAVVEEILKYFDKFPKYSMKILLGDFNAKVGKEDIFKATIGNKSVHEISNDNGIRSKLNGDNLNNIRRETSRHFRNKKREYLKDKIDELAMNSKNKNIRDLNRGINDFKRVSQPSSNLVKDENGDLLADSHNILNRWKNYFSQLLNVHRVSDVRQTEIHTAELLIPDPSPFVVESAIAKLKRYKSPDSDEIPAVLIQARGEILRSKIHNLITSIWHKEKLPDQWKESIIVPVHKKGDKTD
ncbi:hypothetical protein B7P43_G02818 [Cryptotermes secundus]|uniref:Endonuclease/exonuclease/phosphatase domain-containing protein n=1 Tax=Cryptotermes secundus TaxID=105785 RepID=A0A2J7RSX0_9NEOP|nr:hypothetical protein B7P43_G02818 [Cryptotermes secundus]